MKQRGPVLKTIVIILLTCSVFLPVQASVLAVESDKLPQIKFVKQDTVCPEILDLGLTLEKGLFGDTASYSENHLRVRFDAGPSNVYLLNYGITLEITVYPDAGGARQYFNDIPPFQPLSADNSVPENFRSDQEISYIESNAKNTALQRYSLYNDNILIFIGGSTSVQDGFDIVLAAEILKKHAFSVLAGKLDEHFFSGVIKGSDGEPLRNIQIMLKVDRYTYQTVADAYGHYRIDYTGSVKKGTSCILYVPLQYRRDDKTYFRLFFRDKPVWAAKAFKLNSTDDLLQDFDFREAANDPAHYISQPSLEALPHFSAIYFHTSEAVSFYLDMMKFNLEYKLPVDIIIGYDNETYYNPLSSTISISYQDMLVQSPDRPMNREWHEVSHHAMFSNYGRWPENLPGTVNHAGFINPSTSDSLIEGFAIFMSMIIADHYQYPDPEVYSHYSSLELNYKAWQYRGVVEEFAVAGILWDLYDGHNDDAVEMTLNDIWYIFRDYRSDFTAIYEFLAEQYPGLKESIDQIFIDHGFFVDKTAGNARWDPIEPFRDANGNRVFNDGEFFIDYALPKIEYTRGEVVGPASNYQRQQRRSTAELAGQYIKSNSQVPFFQVNVQFPGNNDLDYQFKVANQGGLIYVQLPPPEYQATLAIWPAGGDASNALTFSSQEPSLFSQAAIENGYYLEHEFPATAAIAPDNPLPEPDPGGTPDDLPEWDALMSVKAQPVDYQYIDLSLDFSPVGPDGTGQPLTVQDYIWIGMGLLLVSTVLIVSMVHIVRAKDG